MIFRVIAWPFLVLINILICMLLIVWGVLGTDFGTTQAFNAAQRLLPLQAESVDGNVLNDLTVTGFHYEDDSTRITIQNISWSFNLAALWESPRRVHLKHLDISGADISLAASTQSEPAPEQAEPFALQDIELPVLVQIDRVLINNMTFEQAGTQYSLEKLTLTAKADQKGQTSATLKLVNGPYNSQAKLTLNAGMTKQAAKASVNIESAKAVFLEQDVAASGGAHLNYNGKNLNVNVDQLNTRYADLTINANGALAKNKTLRLAINAPNLNIATPELGGSLTLNADITNAERLDLTANANQVRWLGETQLNTANLHWRGSLAEMELNGEFVTPLLGEQAILLSSQFGWRDELDSLIAATSLAPEALLKQKPLHFKADVTLPNSSVAVSGVTLRENRLGVHLSEAGEIQLSGHSESGKGKIDLNGLVNIIDSASSNVAIQAEVKGERYQLANTPEIKLSASPAITANLADQLLTVRGNITIDNGHIELIVPEEGAVGSSGDVVIIEDETVAPEETPAALARDIQIQLLIAEPITLEGQGFDGSATGKLSVKEKNGRAPKARGELFLAGQYKAYGQDLTIRRGKLIYVDSPIDDPGVDLEAIRTVDEQIAGVRVTGLASNPKIKIFAEPSLSDTEALSYLVLGRGLNDNSERDQVQLRSLALSLGLSKGGKFLEKSKDKLGVDELSIQTGDSNNEASLLVGRQLSKRLYLSTQIGLFEPVTKLFLRYRLSRKCEAVAETGTQQGADVVCTLTSGP